MDAPIDLIVAPFTPIQAAQNGIQPGLGTADETTF